MENVAVPAFDHPQADGQPQFQCLWVVQTSKAVLEVMIGVAHWSLFVQNVRWFHRRFQGCDYFSHRATAEPLLLSPPPAIRLLGPTGWSRCAEVFTDVIKVAQEGALRAEDFPALQADPIGTVANGVNPAV
jgi:hypothetical protein